MAQPKKQFKKATRIPPRIYGAASGAIAPHTIFIVEIKDEKMAEKDKYIPCLPYENQTETFKLYHGTVVKFIEQKELGMGNTFYVVEVLDTGDTVLMPPSFKDCLYKIYSHIRY